MNNLNYKKRHASGLIVVVALTMSLFTLTACDGSGGGSEPTADTSAPTSKSLGLIRITVDGLGTPNPSATAETLGDPGSGPISKALTAQPCYIQLQSPAVASGAFSAGGQQYVAFTFKVRNAQGTSYTSGNTTCTSGTANPNSISNVSLVGIVEPGYGINNTPFLKLTKYDGTNADSSLATTLLPTHGMVFDATNNVPAVAIGQESLQVLTESQIASVAVDPEAASGSYLVPYAYMVRNVDPSKGRTLPANPAAGQYDGEFTYAVKLPVSTDKTKAIYGFKIDLQAVSDSVTRVTQSAEEQTALGDVAANLRALTLGSTDLAVLGGTHVTSTNNGDPICSVRIAGPSTSPAAYLTTNNTSANVAAAPYNIIVANNNAPLKAGFCQPLTYPNQAALFGEFVVSGSQSGQRTSAGHYTGGYSGNNSNVLAFQPIPAFFPGEQVSYTLNSNLSTSGNAHPVPFVGSFPGGGLSPSQAQFVPLTTTATGNSPYNIIKADFNGDGKTDLAVANYSSNTVTILLGDSNGGLAQAIFSPIAVGKGPIALVAADFNKDGLLDLAVANSGDNTVTILLGGGAGTFITPGTVLNVGTNPNGISTGDFNKDGIPDLAVANYGSNTVSILLGNGQGGFTAASGSPITVGTQPFAIAVGDFSADGKVDLAISNYGSKNVTVLLGNGTGGFTAASGSPITVGTNPSGVTVADFNADGKLDLAVTNTNSNTVTVLQGAGNGTFSQFTGSPITVGTGPYSIAAADINADGRLDLVIANTGGNNATILLGTGSGTFTQPTGSPVSVGTNPFSIVVTDLNGDGKPDLVAANGNSNTLTILQGYGTGYFAPPPPSSFPISVIIGVGPGKPISADFNGDGKLDLAVTNQNGNSVSILLGNGSGAFTAASGSPQAVGSAPYSMTTADFNSDGKPDLAVMNGDNTTTILLGNGSGGFSAASGSPVSVSQGTVAAAAADFNGDGVPDLAITGSSNTVTILLGNGNGTFAQAGSSPVTVGSAPSEITPGDFNSDGKVDLAVTNSNDNTVTILLGDGNGNFSQATTSPISVGMNPLGIALGDFNGDGKSDLAVANVFDYTVTILLGNGSGGFTQAAGSPVQVGGYPGRIVANDLNGDGKTDLAVTNTIDGTMTILAGNGNGGFTATAASTTAVGQQPGGIIAGDFFGNHKLGLAVVNIGDNTVSVVPQK